MKDEETMIDAARNADWGQVVANGGPPCFHLEDGHFCLRAERWQGHGPMHAYVPLDGLLRDTGARARRGALEDAERAVRDERLSGETDDEGDKAYNTAIDHAAKAVHQLSLPTIKQMSGLVKDFTRGKTMREYMEELSDE